MCRMLVAIGNTNAEQLLDGLIRMAADENAAHEHNGMGKSRGWKHEDGWGMASLHGGTWKLTKSIRPVFDDPLVADARRVESRVIVLHARKGTEGGKSIEEVHPFHSGRFVFAHNGTIQGNISYSSRFHPKGTTDSEKLFYSILTDFAGEPPLLWSKNERCTVDTGSNIILSTPDKTFVLVYFRKDPHYYRMALGTGKGLVVVSSEALPMVKGVRWRRLNHGDSIVVDHATGKWERWRAASH